ncbi:unnamed protein product [Paramecium primaurelia]|uniref:Cyclic nucleotide-binding domain-containing protein n=1 Tax=Paramecium primaurelia TaxID=5886 RepID=A0A8S1LPQ1_PARPR|nr:unnamed protein product [Paramecium primaurelia]
MLKSIKRKLNSITDRDNNNYEITIDLLKRGDLIKTELDFLMKNFGNLKFFEEQKAKLPLYLYTQIYKNLDYQYVQQCETVFNYGDMGSTFYIILKGQVNVLLPKPQVQDDLKYGRITIEELQQRIENEKSNQFSDFNEFLQVVYQDFVKVRSLSAGDTFGDLALITKSKRTATILCYTDCHFMILHKNAFDRILYEHHNSILKQQLAFFENISYLHGIPDQHLTQLMHQMIEFSPQLNSTIYKENEESHSVYFIISGEVELSYQLNNWQRIVISLMTKGAIFGEEEVLKGIKRTQKAICKSNETVLRTLSAQQFMSTLEIHNLKLACSQQSNQKAQRQSKQILLRRKATESLLLCCPITKKRDSNLDSEITRFHSTRQISLSNRFQLNPPITHSNCLFPIQIPNYLKLIPQNQKPTPLLSRQGSNFNRLKNMLKTERSEGNIQQGLSYFSQCSSHQQQQLSPKQIINIHVERLRKSRYK